MLIKMTYLDGTQPGQDDRLIFRLMMEVRIMGSSGSAYEDLFVEVMRASEPGFRPVKPQGSVGDRKNDGWVKEAGKYWQVYAPEEPSDKESQATAKLDKDFAGLYAYWNKISPIREFYFAVNDKGKGCYPTTEAALAKIQREFKLERAEPFGTKSLMDRFLCLNREQMVHIIGLPPRPEELSTIEFAALTPILGHLMGSRTPICASETLEAPDLDEKIRFNRLGKVPADFLRYGAYQVGRIDQYFDRTADFSRTDVKNRLAKVFDEAKARQSDGNAASQLSDRVFFEMVERLNTSKTQQGRDAAIVLMSYFFESCDIFDEPLREGPRC
jgi:hypothetical protein